VNEKERKKETDNESELKKKKETDNGSEWRRKKEKEIKRKKDVFAVYHKSENLLLAFYKWNPGTAAAAKIIQSQSSQIQI